jgi:DNA-binding transcriptional LysR family regulator
MQMELRQLRYFIAVAEELSFVRGAARVGISQPPLSRQIANLEIEIGTRLFDRNKHGVSITEAGRVFYDEVRQILARLDAAVKTAVRAAHGHIGSLAIGFGGAATYTFMPSLLRRFRTEFPNVELLLQHMPMTRQFDALMEKRIDIGFLILPVQSEALATKLMLRDPLVVAMPSGHPLSKSKSVMLSALAGYDFIVSTRNSGLSFHHKILQLCSRAGFAPHIVQEMSTMESVISLVSTGVGISIVPSTRKLRIPEVEYRPIRDRAAVIDFGMAWHRDGVSPVVETFIKLASKWDRDRGNSAADRRNRPASRSN